MPNLRDVINPSPRKHTIIINPAQLCPIRSRPREKWNGWAELSLLLDHFVIWRYLWLHSLVYSIIYFHCKLSSHDIPVISLFWTHALKTWNWIKELTFEWLQELWIVRNIYLNKNMCIYTECTVCHFAAIIIAEIAKDCNPQDYFANFFSKNLLPIWYEKKLSIEECSLFTNICWLN